MPSGDAHHEISAPSIITSGRGRCRTPGLVAHRKVADLSDAADPTSCAVSGGGNVDLYARIIGQVLTERLGQAVLIDNRGGAGGNIGTEAVVHAAPDGYTLLLVNTANAWNAAIYRRLNFNFIRDITPVASFSRGANILVTNPSFIAKSVPELIAYAKANPGKISMASAGIGSSNHVYGELFKMMAGVDMLHVPYRGGGFALTDIIGGQVDLSFHVISTTLEHIRTGKLRALAVTSATRSPLWPEIPTVGEFVPGYEATGWHGDWGSQEHAN